MKETDVRDRRVEDRKRVRTPVFIRSEGRPMKQCVARNLSATGVFIETKDLGLACGEEVELVFSLEIDRTVKLHRRHAKVVFVRAGGTGLAFRSRAMPKVPEEQN